jgi:hypothetical protein
VAKLDRRKSREGGPALHRCASGAIRAAMVILSMGMTPGNYCENVVCDLHLTDMRSVQVRHGMRVVTKVLDGFACTVKGCTRFFGTEGYSDLTADSEFTDIRAEPSCSNQHEAKPMYIQRRSDCLLWVCPVCNAVAPFLR